MSLNGNRCIEIIFKVSLMRWPLSILRYFTIWFKGDFRHRRTRHVTAATRNYIRLQRRNTTLATIVCRRSNAVCLFEWQHIASSCYQRTPQGTVHGPLLFTFYTTEIGIIVQSFSLIHQTYDGDNQIYSSWFSTECDSLKINVIVCMDVVAKWMASNWLLLKFVRIGVAVV